MSEENMLIIKQINKFGRVLRTPELLKMIEDLEQERDKYKEVIDKLNNKINSLKTCEDKPKEDIIYPHWEICNETKQEMLDILKEVE